MAKSRITWIQNAVIITQDEKRRVLRGHIRIEDGQITRITERSPRKAETGARIIDAQGKAVLPGFVQAHVHLCQTLFRNQADDLELLDWLSKRIWVMEAAHTAETLHTSALLGIHELLSSGTTCILDMGTVRHTDSIFEAVKSSGIRASVGKCLMDHPENTPESLRENSADALAETQSLFKKWNGAASDRIRVSFAPRFVISCTENLLKDVASLAGETRALVHTHASENRKEVELVRKLVGRENVEYLHHIGLTSPRLVLAHCIWLNETEKKLLQQTGTHVTHCPSSNMKLASGFAQIPELRERGINVALGADGAPCNNNLNIFQEMRLAALIHKPTYGPKSMRAHEVLDMATRDGAKALNWFDRIGSIEEGKEADLVCLNLESPENTVPHADARSSLNYENLASSIVYSTQPMHVAWTQVRGETVYSSGRVKGIPTEALMKKVRQAQALIARRINR